MNLILQPDPFYLVTQGLFLKLLGGVPSGIRLVADATDGALRFPGAPANQRLPCLRPGPIGGQESPQTTKPVLVQQQRSFPQKLCLCRSHLSHALDTLFKAI